MVSVVDLATKAKVQWCPGCGDFGIISALKGAVSQLGLEQKDVVVTSGIGCFGKLPHYIKTYGIESLHGRSLAAAQGAKLGNHELNVIAVCGDGDGLGIGMGHFVHAMRRNTDITCIIHNNGVYGLTTGQTSPTSPKGFKSKSTPSGNTDLPVNPVALAIVSGATFVARGYAGDLKHLTDLFAAAIQHRGFSMIDVLQPCVSFNPQYSYQWYQQNIYKLGEEHDSKDYLTAIGLAYSNGPKGTPNQGKIPLGVYYQAESDALEDLIPQFKLGPMSKLDISNIDISDLLKRYL